MGAGRTRGNGIGGALFGNYGRRVVSWWCCGRGEGREVPSGAFRGFFRSFGVGGI